MLTQLADLSIVENTNCSYHQIGGALSITKEFSQWLQTNYREETIKEYPWFANDPTVLPRHIVVKLIANYCKKFSLMLSSSLYDFNSVPHFANLLKIPRDEETGKYVPVTKFKMQAFIAGLIIKSV
jgi:hypothetical protein